MRYNRLGTTDIKVSSLCLGTMTWGEQNSEAHGHEQMDYAVENGINFFDTAELYSIPPRPETYGRTEEIIGTWFRERKNRDKIFLASKMAGPGLAWIRGGGPITGAAVQTAIEGSLRRLKTDYIDLYQLHWSNRPNYHFQNYYSFAPSAVDYAKERENFHEVLLALDSSVRAGKIRHVGLSNEMPWGVFEYLKIAERHSLPRIQTIQNEYSLLCRRFEQDLTEIAFAENVGLLAWSPLAGGMLSGKYANGSRPAGTRWAIDNRILFRDTTSANKAVAAYIELAKNHNFDPCQMALAFVEQQPFVTSTIIGATSMEQLRSNISATNVTLSEEVQMKIQEIYLEHPRPY
ncbi:MAG: aldo/keto reductase [Bdellovibrionales bacterium]|nr:aldo/keto reductase [Bdellovibrionales bacterium]